MRAGALRVDAEQLALAQHAEALADRGLPGLLAGAVHRDLAGAAEERGGEPPLDARPGEVLGLRQERDAPLDDRGHQEVVGERQVVPGDDGRAVLRNVLQTFDSGAEHQPEQWPEEHVLEH